tara:strand:+ start:17 stop:943 length:927 start_codon:yes stop_codon:yes gene_type:complete
MEINHYMYGALTLLIGAAIYNSYIKENRVTQEQADYLVLEKYLLEDSSLAKSKKPIIWIHIDFQENARHWVDFASRKNKNLNLPYLYLTIKSIIDHCGDSFNVFIIDDTTFSKIIPGWTVNMKTISSPILQNIRRLAKAKILSSYGGLFVPPSFVCFKDLIDLYTTGIQEKGLFVCDIPDIKSEFMGCEKNNEIIKKYIHFLEECNSSSFTEENLFLQKENKYIQQNKIPKISGTLVGTKNVNKENIILDDLMSSIPLKLDNNTTGLYIPKNEILSRIKYQWFNRLSLEQLLNTDNQITRHILFSQNK